MRDCSRIDPLVTPFVDGELSSSDRDIVTAHLATCAACQARVASERGARSLIRARREELGPSAAPPALRARCSALCSRRGDAVAAAASRASTAGRLTSALRSRFAPLALAASLMLLVGGAFLYQATRLSPRVMAAELAADHVKCFTLNGLLGTSQSREAVEASMASGFGWPMRLPQTAPAENLDVVGVRPCLYGEGTVAHIMFTHNGQPLSLFMLPRDTREEALLDVFGLHCRVWSVGSRTFVLVSREPTQEVERLASLVRTSMQ